MKLHKKPDRIRLTRMAGWQFRVQEPKPFMEWHLHIIETSLEVASASAMRISRMIGRKTRVISEDGAVLFEVDPREERK